MKYYKITLLKDLPGIDAGFTVELDEDEFRNPYSYYFQKSDIRNPTADIKYKDEICMVWDNKDKPDWVRVEFDLSKAVQIKCPNCDKLGMFGYSSAAYDKLDGDVRRYFKDVGLWCPHCEHKLIVHSVLTG